MSLRLHLILGLLGRLGLVIYGDYHDKTVLVKFTDVDYNVFTDAAKHITNGESPYLRHTYRYTPLLAYLLTPNFSIHMLYGKVLFAIIDVLVGYLIYVLVLYSQRDTKWAMIGAMLWIYNPLSATVSARGNAECIVSALVLAMMVCYMFKMYFMAGALYGLAVHFKIYPIIYALSLYWSVCNNGVREFFKVEPLKLRLVFGAVSMFVVTTALCYSWYGMEFIQEAYLYHITRLDIRHNFSLYFYMLYLTAEWNSILMSLIPFVPQALLILVLAYFYHKPADLPFCFLCQTYVFVTFNKVCTSQYFLWYLTLLFVCLPNLKMKLLEGVTLILIWFFAQVSWLLPAYYLEFEGRNTFLYIWLESIAFFCANIGILIHLIRHYKINVPTAIITQGYNQGDKPKSD